MRRALKAKQRKLTTEIALKGTSQPRSSSCAHICLQPAGCWVRQCGLPECSLRERPGADCLSDTLRGLAQHSRGRPGKLWGHQKNKGSFLQEDSNSAL